MLHIRDGGSGPRRLSSAANIGAYRGAHVGDARLRSDGLRSRVEGHWIYDATQMYSSNHLPVA
jgi:hypothetical protein